MSRAPRKLTDCDKAVLEYLANLGRQFVAPTPSLQQMCNVLPYGLPLIRKSLARLEKEGYITKTPNKNGRLAPIRRISETFNRSTYISTPKTVVSSADVDLYESPWCSTNATGAMKYWQFMGLVERNTEAWCKAQRALVRAPQATEQQVLHFPPDPELYACFFWDDDTQKQAA